MGRVRCRRRNGWGVPSGDDVGGVFPPGMQAWQPDDDFFARMADTIFSDERFSLPEFDLPDGLLTSENIGDYINFDGQGDVSYVNQFNPDQIFGDSRWGDLNDRQKRLMRMTDGVNVPHGADSYEMK